MSFDSLFADLQNLNSDQTTAYAVGDVQGCWQSMQTLIAEAKKSNASLIFLGDIVNRGPNSLEALDFLYTQSELNSKQYRILLGNHDLHFLAVASGVRKPKPSDTLDALLASPKREALVNWLRSQPLAIYDYGFLMVHAGVLPQWNIAQTLALAQEVEAQLKGNNYQDFLAQMYGDAPNQWSENLRGIERLRVIVNALTRIRFCTAAGEMNLRYKAGLDKSEAGLMPWFDVPNRKTQDTPIVFGHWSALGLMIKDNVMGLDTGCVWGGQLTAMRLHAKPNKRNLIQIASKDRALDPLAFD